MLKSTHLKTVIHITYENASVAHPSRLIHLLLRSENTDLKTWVILQRGSLLSPVKRGYCFRFVCLSVCPGHFFFSFCARNSSYSFHHTQTKPIPSESWMSGVCHGGSVFRTPQNFGEIGLWKRPKIINSNFWSVRSQRVLGLEMRYPYHMKALLL